MIFTPLDEVRRSPAYDSTIWQLEPTQQGLLPVAADRGGPINISWEVHGEGPRKIIFIGGLGTLKNDWQRQTSYFGHQRSAEYSVLLLDNRGVGESDKPLMRYSTSEMAMDVLELVDHLEWFERRQLHVVGTSMGGMVAQEIGWLVPDRVASLALCSTTARYKLHGTWAEALSTPMTLLMPKSEERTIQETALEGLPEAWLAAPDDIEFPPEDTPKCVVPQGGWKRFATNYERIAAQDLQKHRATTGPKGTGFVMQAFGAAMHHMQPSRLEELAGWLGRRTMVLHGMRDKMFRPEMGEDLMKKIRPRKKYLVEGVGHAPRFEKTRWYNEILEDFFIETEKLPDHGGDEEEGETEVIKAEGEVEKKVQREGKEEESEEEKENETEEEDGEWAEGAPETTEVAAS